MGIISELQNDFEELFHHKKIARKIIVSSISIDHIKITGKIMSVQFGKAQKVVATIVPLDQNGNPLPASAITGLAAVITDPTIAKVGPVDQTAQTVEIDGVADGATTITYSATNSAGTVITLQDSITISDVVVLMATTLQIVYGTPTAQ